MPEPGDNPNSIARKLAHVSTVFLDRDGVINEKAPEGEYVRSVKELRLLPRVTEAIARLNGAGIRTVVVSNQRGVAKGLYNAADVEAIHRAIQEELGKHGARLDAFIFCPHDKGECQCRKPLPGMFEQAVKAFPAIRPDECVMIGDSLVDIEFGRRLGMPTILIEDAPSRLQTALPDIAEAARNADWRANSLSEAVELLFSARPGVSHLRQQ